jgi:hypothetical protein
LMVGFLLVFAVTNDIFRWVGWWNFSSA